MRSSFYDNKGWVRASGMVPQKWEPGEPPAPYGEVPGTEPPAPNTPRSRLAPTPQRERRKKTDRKEKFHRERSGKAGFCLVLSLLLILTGVAVYLQGGVLPGESPMEQFRDQVGDRFGGWDPYDGYAYPQENDWVAELDKTSIPLAATGDGTTLTLTPNEGETLTPQEIYARVSPAVVGIRAVAEVGMHLGTGVVMSSDGYIITNAHIISGTREASVVFSDNSVAQAQLVGYDGETDLAVLKVERQGLTAAVFGDSTQLRVGDPAYAIGNPLGEELRGTMTDGIISATDRTVDMDGQSMTLLQTTAALNSGNSGGALLNAAGQVVGITNMKMMSEWETIEGLGFAVPTSLAKLVVDQIIDTGSYAGRPTLGITVQDHFDANGFPDGAEVVSVKKSSDASGRLFAGDVIVGAQGGTVTCTEDLLRIKNWYVVGEDLTLQVWTGEEILEIPVRLQRSSGLNQDPDLYTRRDGE